MGEHFEHPGIETELLTVDARGEVHPLSLLAALYCRSLGAFYKRGARRAYVRALKAVGHRDFDAILWEHHVGVFNSPDAHELGDGLLCMSCNTGINGVVCKGPMQMPYHFTCFHELASDAIGSDTLASFGTGQHARKTRRHPRRIEQRSALDSFEIDTRRLPQQRKGKKISRASTLGNVGPRLHSHVVQVKELASAGVLEPFSLCISSKSRSTRTLPRTLPRLTRTLPRRTREANVRKHLRGGACEESVDICETWDMEKKEGLVSRETYNVSVAAFSGIPSVLSECVSSRMYALKTNGDGACGIHALLGTPVRTALGSLELFAEDARETAVTHLGPSFEVVLQRPGAVAARNKNIPTN